MWIYLGFAVLLEVTASLGLKGALDNPWLYIFVVTGYVGSFGCLYLALRAGMNLGVGYGIWGASGVALTAVMSAILFSEPLNGLKITGIATIMAGVLLVELGKPKEHLV